MELQVLTLDDFELTGKTVLLRVDINSPVDRRTKAINDDMRIRRCLPTIRELADRGARVAILAHQGDPLDYENFTLPPKLLFFPRTETLFTYNDKSLTPVSLPEGKTVVFGMRPCDAASLLFLDKVFIDAGAEWRFAGCSMCLGMNPDTLSPGQRAASTSNRNFEGRQGRGGRTHLVSPQVAAATAVVGKLAAPADLS